jgi:hypothetical protein
MTIALTATCLNVATVHAAPPPDPGPAASCAFTLTPPSLVNVTGIDMVTATMSPGECTGVIQPNSYLVCVEILGEGRPQCKFRPVFDPVSVYFTPYRKGATYQSTARVCGNVFPSADQSCSSLGPYTATL